MESKKASEPRTPLPSVREQQMTPEGREAIALFRKFRAAEDKTEKEMLAKIFWDKILDLVTPPKKGHNHIDSAYLAKVLEQGTESDGLGVGAATSGQRIYFNNHQWGLPEGMSMDVPESSGLKVASLGYGPADTLVETIDDKVRWMVYLESGDHLTYGKEYWERFVQHFGSASVDLLKE